MKSPFTREEVDTRSIHIETLYSLEKGKGFVGILWGDNVAQLTPNEAREHALKIIEAASVAEQDDITMKWLQQRVGVDDMDAARMLQDLRAIRTGIREKE